MSLTHSPSIVTNELIMYYDMSNTMKSWKGAPTTNLITYPQADWNGSSFALSYDYKGNGVGNATQTFDTSIETPLGDYSGVMKYTTGSAGITTYPDGYKYWAIRINGLTAGVTYTFSYYAKASIESNFANGQLWRDSGTDYSPSGDWNPTFTTEWRRYSTTRTMVGTYLDYFPIHSGNLTGGHTIYYWGFQMEVGSFATPFVAGTRSSTQAIVDLTSNNTITANSVVYASDGTFSFSNGYVSLPSLNLQRNFTLECWVKLTSVGAAVGFFGQGPTAGNQGLHIGWFPGRGLLFGMYGNDLEGPAYSMTYNVWHHFAFTYDHSTYFKQTFADGVLVSSGALNQYSGSGQFNIGSIYSSPVYQSFTGNFAVARAYSKVLSAAEIQQNFNAQRGRYGI